MKKIIVHVVYLLIIGFFVVYGNIKANEAEKNMRLAQTNDQKAKIENENALKAIEAAEQAAAEALVQIHRAKKLEDQLNECQGK
ncbi:MAG: hypothetical protein RIC35_18950 [Marinoscillum sp.]